MYSASCRTELGKTAHQSPHKRREKLPVPDAPQLMASFNFFMAKTRTVLDAGLALKTHGSLVKGFTPLRAGVAGFFFSFMFNIPANLKAPFFLSCSAATPMMPSITLLTCFAFNPLLSATDEYTAVAVKAVPVF